MFSVPAVRSPSRSPVELQDISEEFALQSGHLVTQRGEFIGITSMASSLAGRLSSSPLNFIGLGVWVRVERQG
ncbi:hypothetical protein [Deinococcus alpinitundrae]|uniref:hypothetical protein n=1 Tax=Deinococcus alpinitundrae TaxID=468913 RepID=UPI00137AD965|nr:hypothetical protein [Deinococcus alpinitundrae]